MSTPGLSTPAADAGRPAPGLAATVALYTLARLAVVAVVAVLLSLAGVPLLVGILIGLIVALPLSMFLFRGLRLRLDEAIAASGRRRADVRAQLRGEPPGSEHPAEGQPDGGAERPAE